MFIIHVDRNRIYQTFEMEGSFKKANTTEKTEIKRTQPTRMTEYSASSRLIQTEVKKKGYEKPQPIKIAQLYKQSEDVKSSQKDTARKRMQPERIGAFSTTKKAFLSKTKNEMNADSPFARSGKSARRNLNFYETSNSARKVKKGIQNKPKENVSPGTVFKTNSVSIARRSFLLPPNTIKCRYLQNCNGKVNNCLNDAKISEERTSNKEHGKSATGRTVSSKKLKASKHSSTKNVGSSAMQSENTEPSDKTKSNECLKLSDRFEECNVNNAQSNATGIQKSSISMQVRSVDPHLTNYQKVSKEGTLVSVPENTDLQSIPITNYTSRSNGSAGLKDTCLETLCNDLRNSKLIEQGKSKNTNQSSSEMIYVNKQDVLDLQCKLESFISIAEENVSNLKSALTYIRKIVSLENTEVSPEVPEQEKQEIVKTVLINDQVDTENCTEAAQLKDDLLEVSPLPEVTITNIECITAVETPVKEENKENCAHIDPPVDSEIVNALIDESFLKLENDLNIKHIKRSPIMKFRQSVPIVIQNGKRGDRSLKEYMALKSSMSFLETPEARRFRPLCKKDAAVDQSILSKRYISSKVLTDLHNLYSESPDY